ncbi:MAG: hypothetical protein JO215_09495 [Ktedonobacteraceae bacterium]|nr:hypothetical protein [Ktedonobacteraceae bacterium]
MSEIHSANGNNNEISNTFNSIDTETTHKNSFPDYIDTVFQRIDAQDVEQFYKSYHFWSLQQRLKTLQAEIGAVQQAIADNDKLMQQVRPSAIALASLAQLQASGVNDLDLLDRMLERGETWLDHTMQLLEHCEELDVIRGDYTQWCEHALEGAYNWIASMDTIDTIHPLESETAVPPASQAGNEQQRDLQAATEEQLLQKLMSDEDATEKIPTSTHQVSATAQETTIPSLPTRKITQPLQAPEQAEIEPSLPTRKITQPLHQAETLAETESPATLAPDELERLEIADSPGDESISQVETPLPSEVVEDATSQTEKRPALTIKQSDETIEIDSEQVEEDAEPPHQTKAEPESLLESQQANKKPQIRTVRNRGIWRLLTRLLAIILRR